MVKREQCAKIDNKWNNPQEFNEATTNLKKGNG